ncbi:MAG: TolC family protein [Bacteroidia bacterium]|nr:TolC family protein [Bacteroidia bacterium]
MKYLLALIFFVFCSFAMQAQKQWTLKECVDYALENNIQIKQSQINLEIAEQDNKTSFGSMLPSLNLSSNYDFRFGRSLDFTTYTFTNQQTQLSRINASTNVTLFNGFQLRRTLEQSKLNVLASKSDLQKAADDVTLNVIASYLQVLYGSELAENANKRVESLTKQKDKTAKLVEAGSLAKGSLLDVESQVANEELNFINADNALKSSLLTLVQLLEIKSVDGFEVIPPNVNLPNQEILSLTPEQIYAAALNNQPEIKSSEYYLQSAEKGWMIAKAGRYPSLSLGGFSGTDYINTAKNTVTGEDISVSDQFDNNLNHSVGFSLSIPVFNGWFTSSNITKAKLGMQNAEYGHELIKNSLYKSIQQAHSDAVAALKKYQASEKSVSALRESYTYTEKKFNVGLLTSLEYLTATNNLAIAESDLLQAKYDLIFRIKILEFYNGNPLTF